MTVWIAMAGLTALVVGLLVWPLARARAGDDRLARDLAVYRDQLRELDLEAERGIIRAEERDVARTEIERRMLRAADADAVERAAAPARPRGMAAALVIALGVPLIAVPLYLRLGAPDMPDQPFAARTDSAERRTAVARFEEMAERLAARLRETPEDVQGWKLLGRTYGFLDRHAESADAYRRAAALDPTDVSVLSLLGEAMVYAAGGEVEPEAVRIFERAHAFDANEPAARFYLALARAQAGDLKGAYDGWLALAKATPADAAWRDALMQHLGDAAKRLGVDLAEALPPVSAGPGKDQVEAAGQMSAEDRSAMIRSMVERLADRLRERPNDVQGWMRLAQAYTVLDRKTDAADAYRRALDVADPQGTDIIEIKRRLDALTEK